MNTSKKQAKIWETLVTHNLKEKKINVPAQPYFNTVWSLSYFKRKAEFNTEKTIKYCAMLAYPYCYIARFLSFLEQCVKKVKLMSYFLFKKKKNVPNHWLLFQIIKWKSSENCCFTNPSHSIYTLLEPHKKASEMREGKKKYLQSIWKRNCKSIFLQRLLRINAN